MKIALISYEYPPDTAYGGIATYVFQAAQMLRARGHLVEVFAASPRRSGAALEHGVRVNRVQLGTHRDFAAPIGAVFAERHAAVGFDVLEGPEWGADAREAVRLVPDIPFVLKLHTSSIMLLRLSYGPPSFSRKARIFLNAIRSGRLLRWGSDPEYESAREHFTEADRTERRHALDADEVAAPCKDIGIELVREWGLDARRVEHVPYPFVVNAGLLEIPVETRTYRVSFVGRLEIRKGVEDLARAIPLILRRCPEARFRFVGSSEGSPRPGVDMRQYLQAMLRPHRHAVTFTGPVDPERIPSVLADTDVCVFPSLWENFPCVCLEAMAAARGIVGSSAGGMTDMLDENRAGRLVPPRSPAKIAEATTELLLNPELRMQLGQAARERLLSEYSADRIGVLQEASYERAIARRREAGPRRAAPPTRA